MEHLQDDLKITEQAHDWYAMLPEAGPQERAAFASWLKASPRHVGEFLLVTAVHRHYANLDPQRHIDVEALLAEAEEDSNVVPLQEVSRTLSFPQPEREQESDGHRRRWVAGGIAVGVLAITFVAHWQKTGRVLDQWKTYETLTGENRSVQFDDGSTAHLNTQSQMQVRFVSESREVRLLAGEVLFEVKPNPERPFRVYSGAAAIQALGTQFDVYRQARNTKVSVLEGQVQISTQDPGRQVAKLIAGESAEVAADGYITPLAATEASRSIAWRKHKLIFRGDTLAYVVAEFNRYNRVPKFRIDDARTSERRISGAFDSDAPESFVRVLLGLGDLTVERKENEIIIRQR